MREFGKFGEFEEIGGFGIEVMSGGGEGQDALLRYVTTVVDCGGVEATLGGVNNDDGSIFWWRRVPSAPRWLVLCGAVQSVQYGACTEPERRIWGWSGLLESAAGPQFSGRWGILAWFWLILGGLGRKVGPKMADWEIELQVE